MNRLPAISLLSLVVLSGGLSASRLQPSERKSVVFIQGNDTVGRESFTRSGSSLSGDLLLGQRHLHYEGELSPDGAITRLDVRTSGPGVTRERLTSIIIGRDSAQVIRHLGNTVDTLHFASQPGLLPIINPSIALVEFITARARAEQSQTSSIPVLSVDEAAIGSIEVSFVSPDTAAIGFANGPKPMRVSLDGRGRVLGGTLGARRITILPTFTPVRPGM